MDLSPIPALRRLTAAAAVAVLLALSALAAPAPASAAAAPSAAWVRIAHALTDAPEVAATVAGQAAADRVAFGAASQYVQVPAGSQRVEVRAAGTSAAPLLATDVDLGTGGATTVVVTGTPDAPEAVVVRDDLTAPAPGTAKVRLVHAAPGQPAVWARTRVGERLYAGTGYATASAYEQIPAGVYDIEMLQAGTENVLQVLRGVTVRAGSVSTLVGVGGAPGEPPGIVALDDVVGTATAPRGGVAAGAGGTAAGAGGTAAGVGGTAAGVGGTASPAGTDLGRTGGPAALAAVLLTACAAAWVAAVRREA